MGLWEIALGLFIMLNLRILPFIWNFRFFRALWIGIRLHRKAASHLQPHHIFLSTICTLRTPLIETDFNMHKSNSTYFTDLDIVRAYHSGVIFGPLFMPKEGRTRVNFIVGAVSCTFKREIKPYRKYETSTRVVSWDEKWIYMVTHFVEYGKIKTGHGLLQCDAVDDSMIKKPEGFAGTEKGPGVFASAITRFVCKRGRVTLPPVRALEECGLLPLAVTSIPDGTGERHSRVPENIEAYRIANLSIVRLQQGWEKVHELFKEQDAPLGRFREVL